MNIIVLNCSLDEDQSKAEKCYQTMKFAPVFINRMFVHKICGVMGLNTIIYATKDESFKYLEKR